VIGSCEHKVKLTSVAIKGRQSVHQVSSYQLFKKDLFHKCQFNVPLHTTRTNDPRSCINGESRGVVVMLLDRITSPFHQ